MLCDQIAEMEALGISAVASLMAAELLKSAREAKFQVV